MGEGGVVEGLVGAESEERDPEGVAPADAIAASIAIEQAKFDPELSRKAGNYLDDQRALVRLQLKHFDQERRLAIDAARRKRYADRIRNTLATLLVLIVVGVIALLLDLAWGASRDHGLVIDTFAVPPTLAQEGLSGEVVAARFLDKLQGLQKATQSVRPAKSFQNNWDSGLKVEIPETGITFGEVEKLLRAKLSHASHIKGEIFRTTEGIALTVRLDDEPAQTFTGPQSNLDELAQRAAEAIYSTSQPYRYADYLAGQGHVPQAIQLIAETATAGPTAERGWAYAQWAFEDLNGNGDIAAAVKHARKGVDYASGSAVLAYVVLAGAAVWAGHSEEEINNQHILDRLSRERSDESSKSFFESTNLINAAYDATLEGNLKAAAERWPLTPVENDLFSMQKLAPALTATAYAQNHDLEAAGSVEGLQGLSDDSSFLLLDALDGFMGLPRYWVSAEAQDWAAALADARSCEAWIVSNQAQHGVLRLLLPVWIRPLEALALAKTGDIVSAEALIGTTPLDCYPCLRVRAQIAAQKHDWMSAEHWFAQAVKQAPTPPFAYAEWGQMRLAKGDVVGALSEFRLAHKKGPHFADALKGMGDALALQGNWRDAQARYDEALKNAPAWKALQQARATATAHLHRS